MTTCYDLMTTHRVVSYNPVTTCRIVSYDPVTTSWVVSYDPVTTSRVVSYDPVTTSRVVSYDPVTTRLSSVKELTDDSDNPTDDKWQPDYFGRDWSDGSCKINRQKQDFFCELPVLLLKSLMMMWCYLSIGYCSQEQQNQEFRENKNIR